MFPQTDFFYSTMLMIREFFNIFGLGILTASRLTINSIDNENIAKNKMKMITP